MQDKVKSGGLKLLGGHYCHNQRNTDSVSNLYHLGTYITYPGACETPSYSLWPYHISHFHCRNVSRSGSWSVFPAKELPHCGIKPYLSISQVSLGIPPLQRIHFFFFFSATGYCFLFSLVLIVFTNNKSLGCSLEPCNSSRHLPKCFFSHKSLYTAHWRYSPMHANPS